MPDLKESVGGLRDATVLKALVATWLVDVPHARPRALPAAAARRPRRAARRVGRSGDRPGRPGACGRTSRPVSASPDAEAAQRHVRGLGRRITHLSRLDLAPRRRACWRRPADRPPARPGWSRSPPGSPSRAARSCSTGAPGPADDPLLLLRAAAEAAERDARARPGDRGPAGARGRRRSRSPWPAEARDLFVRLLAAGPGLLAVWETLDETGALEPVLPEWERVRLLPHASVVHRFTVDRHLVETCIEASRADPPGRPCPTC